ncbi:MAG TPA: transposase [Gammaproteobacteria bacterium]|nr:transposase [Gammaproteobacteria bacterium]
MRHRQKLEAQGRSLLINHSLPAPAHWWKNQTWLRLSKLLPAWISLRLEVHRPALLTLQQQISVLSAELEAAAPADVPAGVGKLTTVVMTREICSWERFRNRRAISSYTGLCPGEHTSGAKRIPGSVTKRGNPRLRAALVECAWRMVRFQPNYPPVNNPTQIVALTSVLQQVASAVDIRIAQLDAERTRLLDQKSKLSTLLTEFSKPSALDHLRKTILEGQNSCR